MDFYSSSFTLPRPFNQPPSPSTQSHHQSISSASHQSLLTSHNSTSSIHSIIQNNPTINHIHSNNNNRSTTSHSNNSLEDSNDHELPTSTPLVSRIPSCLPSHPHQHSPSNSIINNTPPTSTTSNHTSSSHHSNLNQSSSDSSLPSIETVSRTCVNLMSQHPCLITCHQPNSNNHPLTTPSAFTFHLSGAQSQVMMARGRLLRENPFEVRKVVRMSRTDILEGGTTVRPQMKRKLDEIASVTRAHLSIVGSDGGIGEVDVVIRGEYEAVEQARVRLLVLFDQLISLHSDVCEIDYKLHHIIAGRKRMVIQSIQEETSTNIYFPSALSGGGILGTRNSLLISKQNMIFITGEYFGVQRAREMLFQVSLHKSKCIISRDTALLPRKLDWILMEKLEEIKKIMNDNGTFINFPPIGSQISVISVYGDNVIPIERSIRMLMQLACDFYTANIWLLSTSYTDFFSSTAGSDALNQNEVTRALNIIAADTGAELVFKGTNSFEVYGTEIEVTTAVNRLLELDLVKPFQAEIRFQVELACEHRDFISGKKNGKLNKIMKGSNVKIKFESFNDYNFLIDLSGGSTAALAGLKLLQEELPAEISFHIPESYHKRIIGVGGKNIQRIMKKYGVYVKFSNADEFNNLGGYVDNHDNVIARTPAKNAPNLENLKQSVMELVHPKDKNYITKKISIPRQSHRTLLGEKGIFLHDIETKTGTRFYFPSSESGIEKIEVFGPETQLQLAIQMILIHVGLECERRLPVSEDLMKAIRSDDFKRDVIEACTNVNVRVISQGEEVIIKFSILGLSSSTGGSSGVVNVEWLRNAKARLDKFLVDRKVQIQAESGSPEVLGGKYVRNRSRTTSSSYSLSAFPTPPTPTDVLFPLAPSQSTAHHLGGHHQEFKPFDNPNLHYGGYGAQSNAILPKPVGRIYNHNASVYGVPGGLGAVGSVGPDWHHTIPRQMVIKNDRSETAARIQQQQISEQIRRLSARAQSLDLGIVGSGRGAGAVGRHRITQSGSGGGLGLGL
ncbi:hypothetical protein DFH28DRAFT_637662 [Melampsora americana]|nr:hypothetical protein DFH28DRAFT_637662 [Melampsora americana]